MNEQIRELAEQAGIKIIPMIVDGIEYEYEDVDMDGSEDLAKFAELIIKECAKIADDGFASSNFGNGITGHQLLKHFGVEE